jgi:hypothetical protein
MGTMLKGVKDESVGFEPPIIPVKSKNESSLILKSDNHIAKSGDADEIVDKAQKKKENPSTLSPLVSNATMMSSDERIEHQANDEITSNKTFTRPSEPPFKIIVGREESTVKPMVVVNATFNSTSSRIGGDPTAKTLALLYPTGLLGGYRNQAMRFIALTKRAIDYNISQMLLPTLVWSTKYPEDMFPRRFSKKGMYLFWPIPFESLFDVDHWNSYTNGNIRLQEEQKHNNLLIPLPRLVDSIDNGDCWIQNTLEEEQEIQQLFNASPAPQLTKKIVNTLTMLRPTSQTTQDYLLGKIYPKKKFRALQLRHLVKRCEHPFVYGGGGGCMSLAKLFSRL